MGCLSGHQFCLVPNKMFTTPRALGVVQHHRALWVVKKGQQGHEGSFHSIVWVPADATPLSLLPTLGGCTPTRDALKRNLTLTLISIEDHKIVLET